MANNDCGVFTLKEFYNRGVIKLAPDVLVYIGGSLTTKIIAPVSGENRNLTFSDGITTVSIQNNVDPPGSSSATIEVVTPIYGEKSNYWTLYRDDNGGIVRAPLFVPMMEVKVFFKGRFLVDMQPKYYPAFWGFIKDVDEQYSGGVYKMTLNCVDILHWWQYSTINVHPVPQSNIMAGGGQALTVWSTIFKRSNPFDIIYKLTSFMGMENFITTAWAAQKTNLQSIYPTDLFKKVSSGIMSYWQERFNSTASLLKMYGMNGKRVNKMGIQAINPESIKTKVNNTSQIQQAVGDLEDYSFSRDLNFLQNFEVYADFGQMGTFENSEYKTKLDIATDVKNRIDYEFYQDVDGCFIFKPPFYNLNVKGILPYTILPGDIINYSVNLDSEGIVTVMTVNTPMNKNLRTTSYALGKGFHMDIELAKRYGIRPSEMTMEYIPSAATQDAEMARSLALGQMALINAKATTGNVTIPGRPEIRLGYPIYLEHRDTFHYVKAINHSFDFGGSFSTTLSLETERRKIYNPIDNFKTTLKDKVFRFKENFVPSVKSNYKDPPQITTTEEVEKKQMDLYKGEGRIVSMNQGRYELDNRNNNARVSEKFITVTTVPYTDEDAYQLVGSFPYGRNVNALCVVSDASNIPVLKDVYLTTMARPLYKYESESMGILFFEDKEGSVPSYLNTDNNAPQILGKLSNNVSTLPTNESNVLKQQMTEKNPAIVENDRIVMKDKDISAGSIQTITNARPPIDFKQDYYKKWSQVKVLNDVNKLSTQTVIRKP